MKVFFAIPLAFALAGCSLLGGGKKSDGNIQYSPVVAVAASPSSIRIDKQMVVDVTYISPALNNLRIAVRPTGHEMEVYKNVRWAVTPSEMLTTHLLENFERSGAFRSVARSGAGLQADLRLSAEVRHFESIYQANGSPAAVITVVVKLVNAGEERAIQSREFEVTVPSAGTDVPSVVDAFASALSRTSADIANWAAANAR